MKQKCFLPIFLTVIAIIGIAEDASCEESLMPSSESLFRQFQSISVACPIGAAPFSYKDEDGEIKGSVIDLWRLWSEKTGIAVRLKGGIWKETVEDVCSGKADIHAIFDEPDHPCLDMIALVPTADFSIALFWSNKLSGIKGIEDLSGIKIGIIKGISEESYVRQHYPKADLMLYPSLPAIIESAQKKEIKALIAEEESVIWWLKKRGIFSEFQFIPEQPLIKNTAYAAVKKGNTALA
ncbi:MAG: hypothetical protein BWK80_30205, partial [Desulfobacteraceae bacterium IS3]